MVIMEHNYIGLVLENIPKEMKQFIGIKNITANIFRIQTNDSTMCGYLCTGFIHFIVKGKSVLDLSINFLLTSIKRMAK